MAVVLDDPGSTLPRAIRGGLAVVGRRLRVAAAIGGVGRSLGVAAAIAAAVMAADFLRPLPVPWRWALWAVAVGATAAVLVVRVVRPLLARPGPVVLAAVAERTCPSLAGRLATAVELAAEGDRAHGSAALVAAVVAEADDGAEAADFAAGVPLRRARNRLLAGLGLAAVVAMPGLLGVDPFATLGRRVLMPWTDPATAGLVRVEVEPGDRTIARGEPLTVTATVSARLVEAPSSPSWSDRGRRGRPGARDGPGGRRRDVRDHDPGRSASRSPIGSPPADRGATPTGSRSSTRRGSPGWPSMSSPRPTPGCRPSGRSTPPWSSPGAGAGSP